jgi:hypothetical protein
LVEENRILCNNEEAQAGQRRWTYAQQRYPKEFEDLNEFDSESRDDER